MGDKMGDKEEAEEASNDPFLSSLFRFSRHLQSEDFHPPFVPPPQIFLSINIHHRNLKQQPAQTQERPPTAYSHPPHD